MIDPIAHKLELIMNSANNRKGHESGCKKNCENLSEALKSFSSFFKQSPKNTALLKEFLKRHRLTGMYVTIIIV